MRKVLILAPNLQDGERELVRLNRVEEVEYVILTPHRREAALGMVMEELVITQRFLSDDRLAEMLEIAKPSLPAGTVTL